jgi:putative phosphoribosyl transferase
VFRDRTDAGEKLAARLQHLKQERPVVVALPRGGVPVAFEVAKALEAPLDVILIRKIGAPGQPELAVGAVTDGDQVEMVINESLADATGASANYIERQKEAELKIIEQRHTSYFKGLRRPEIKDRTVIVIDDGIATGASIRVAVKAFRRRGARRLVVAVPVGPSGTVRSLQQEVDEFVCLDTPEFFPAVGAFYRDFTQTTDEDVIDLLGRAATFPRPQDRSPGAPPDRSSGSGR